MVHWFQSQDLLEENPSSAISAQDSFQSADSDPNSTSAQYCRSSLVPMSDWYAIKTGICREREPNPLILLLLPPQTVFQVEMVVSVRVNYSQFCREIWGENLDLVLRQITSLLCTLKGREKKKVANCFQKNESRVGTDLFQLLQKKNSIAFMTSEMLRAFFQPLLSQRGRRSMNDDPREEEKTPPPPAWRPEAQARKNNFPINTNTLGIHNTTQSSPLLSVIPIVQYSTRFFSLFPLCFQRRGK